MDFKKYYINQSGSSYPIFRGSHFQRGYGIGGVFRRLFSWFMPILKEHALPATKSIGKEVIKSTAKFASDLIDGKKDLFSINESKNNQKGNGYKRKRNLNLFFVNSKKTKRKRLNSKK